MCCELHLFGTGEQLGDLQHWLSLTATFSYARTKSKTSAINEIKSMSWMRIKTCSYGPKAGWGAQRPTL